MEALPRHQCLIYEGAPSLHLPALARIISSKLREHYRCLYLNNPTNLAGMKLHLANEGVDVENLIRNGSLILTSERQHLVNGHFDTGRMLQSLDDALESALRDGYTGLWATGDMSWEMGAEKNLDKLLDYERRLESFFETHPQIGGVCQYQGDTLPRHAVRHGLLAHPALFINQTLSILNEHYRRPGATIPEPTVAELNAALDRLLRPAATA